MSARGVFDRPARHRRGARSCYRAETPAAETSPGRNTSRLLAKPVLGRVVRDPGGWTDSVVVTSDPFSAPTPGGSMDTGHAAWVLTSASLVLLMTPGLALFYGG